MTTTKYLWPAPGMKLRDANMVFIPEDGAELPLDTLTYRRIAAKELLDHDPRRPAPVREAFPDATPAAAPAATRAAGTRAGDSAGDDDTTVRETFEREG